MKKNIFKRVAVLGLSVVTLMTTACNTKIKVDYGYNPLDYIDLGKYKGIEATVDVTSITNEIIDGKIQDALKSNATYTEVDREARAGDKVTFSYSGSVGGLEVTDLCGSDYSMNLGTDTFILKISEITEALYGMSASQSKILTVTLPDNFSMTEYAGKKAVFEVTMSYVEQVNIPMLTDAYVKETYNYDSIDAYREYVKKDAQSEIDAEIKEAKEEAVLTQLQDSCTIKNYPDELISQQTDKLNESISFYATLQGFSNDEYCQKNFNMSFDDFVKKSVAQLLIYQAIVKSENMYITEYDYKGNLEQFAKSNGYSSKSVFTDAYDKDTIVKSMLIQNAQDFVMDNAIITEK
ncbi:MAG: FKBP-type peptidyl-prolyl cis-trans isomerase [Lachnospira sp.]